MSANGIKRRMPVCPICQKNDQVIPILYGMPSPDAFEEAQQGKVHLGGCCIFDDQPQFYCKRDDREF